jgi:hypothetical protein
MKFNPTARAGRRLAASVALAGAFLLPLTAFASAATSAVARTLPGRPSCDRPPRRGQSSRPRKGAPGPGSCYPARPVHAFPDNVVSVWTGHYANGTTYADGAAYTPSTP